ncbi:hypothetical protein ACOMHN_018898 [Nucella lapillus]
MICPGAERGPQGGDVTSGGGGRCPRGGGVASGSGRHGKDVQPSSVFRFDFEATEEQYDLKTIGTETFPSSVTWCKPSWPTIPPGLLLVVVILDETQNQMISYLWLCRLFLQSSSASRQLWALFLRDADRKVVVT